MTKFPTHHHIWSRANGSTRASSILARRGASTTKYSSHVASATSESPSGSEQHARDTSGTSSGVAASKDNSDAWIDVGAAWASHASWQTDTAFTLPNKSTSSGNRSSGTGKTTSASRNKQAHYSAVHTVATPRAISSAVHSQAAVARHASPRAIRYYRQTPFAPVARFSTSVPRSTVSQVHQPPNLIDDIEVLVSQFDAQAISSTASSSSFDAWPLALDSASTVQLWTQEQPDAAFVGSSIGLPDSLIRSLDTRSPAYDFLLFPSSSTADPLRSRATSLSSNRYASSIHLAGGNVSGGAAGGDNRSAGGHSSGANGSGSGSGSSSSSSSHPGPTSQSRSTTGNGSPSPSPSPGSSTILDNSNQNGSNSSTNNSTPVPFPFPPSRVSLQPSATLHPIDVQPPGGDTPRAFSLAHHIDSSIYDAPFYEFQHGAYGIPKRHPLAAVSGVRGSTQPPASSSRPKERRSVLGIAADFLTGPMSLPPAPDTSPHPPRSTQSSTSRQWKEIDPEHLRSVQVGEDAYFLRPDSLGIADGVGGWANRPGANPAMFSRLLMHFCSVELSRYDHLQAAASDGNPGAEHQKFWDVDPVEVMQRAWERCVRVSRREGILGSSTALLAMLRGDQLRIANLGDCVLLIVRQGDLLFRSQEQQHSFNFPVQLGMMIKRGTRDVEQLVKSWANESASSSATSSAHSEDEDFDTPENEAAIRKHSRHLHESSAEKLGQRREKEAEEKRREEEGLRRRAEFEGRDMKEFEAEMQANKEFDFDVNSGSSATSGHSTTNEPQVDSQGGISGTPFGVGMGSTESRDTTEDGKTVYVGVDEDHPWDEPRRDCGRWTIRVEKGDIIIVASDGLVDNLFDDDILEEVQRFAPPPQANGDTGSKGQDMETEDYHLPPDLRRDSGIDLAAMANGLGPEPARSHDDSHLADYGRPSPSPNPAYPPPAFSPQLLSEALCSRAKAISQDSKAVISPFQQKATEEGLHYVGGKHDDISVLVAVVGEAERHQTNRKDTTKHSSRQGPQLMFHGARAAS